MQLSSENPFVLHRVLGVKFIAICAKDPVKQYNIVYQQLGEFRLKFLFTDEHQTSREFFAPEEVIDVSCHSLMQARSWFGLLLKWIIIDKSRPQTFVVIDNPSKCTLLDQWPILPSALSSTFVFLCKSWIDLTPWARTNLDFCIVEDQVMTMPCFLNDLLVGASCTCALPALMDEKKQVLLLQAPVQPSDYDLAVQLFTQKDEFLQFDGLLLPELQPIVEQYLFNGMIVDLKYVDDESYIWTSTAEWKSGEWYWHDLNEGLWYRSNDCNCSVFSFGTFHNGCFQIPMHDASKAIQWWYEQAYQSKYKSAAHKNFLKIDFIYDYLYAVRQQLSKSHAEERL